MNRLAHLWIALLFAPLALGAGCSSKSMPAPRPDARQDAMDCSLVGCAAPPPCGQLCTAPCGCCANPACTGDAAVEGGAGADRGPADGRPAETAPAEAGSDAPAKTACGPVLSCTTATEICVEKGPMGPTTSFTCHPVPAGCETQRTCACVGSALCTGAFSVCNDVYALNTIFCECPTCQ